jgi:two-component system phosphate regulon sensor histidine kinase PhoR
MKERKLKIIVLVMTAAVIGLIIVQLYWIMNLIKVEDEKFHRAVNETLMNVSHRIEEEEAAKSVVKRIIHRSNQAHNKMSEPEQLDVMVWNDNGNEKMIKVIADSFHFEYPIDRRDNSRLPDTNARFFKPHPDGNGKFPPPVIRNIYLDTLISSRKKLVQNVVTEIMMVNVRKKIEDRISTDQLNKLLTQEFRERGIKNDFYFGVKKYDKNNLALLKSGTDTTELKKSDLNTLLFPGEIFFGENRLLVYFPNKNFHLLSSIAGMMSLSIGFIFIIIYVFYKTVQMLLKQKKLTEVKNDLINNITHEFKTPISTISLACEALNEPTLLTGKDSVTRYSGIIKDENDRLKMMVDALLNTAAMEKSNFNLKKENMDIHEIIRNTANNHEQTIHQRNGRIEFDFGAANPIVIGDRFHLSNIFSTLIDNGIKYNENEPVIDIKTLNSDDSLVVLIKDNGIGIPKEHLCKIFDTFYRVSSGNIQNVRGNGIGLSYAKKIIEELRGNISVYSEPGRGSTFEIKLPVQK